MKYSGSCLCSAVSFETAADAIWCSHCHCTQCQKAHAAAFVTWAGFPEEKVNIYGDNRLKWYKSSAEAERGFCSECGSTLFFRSTRWAGELHIARSLIRCLIDGEGELVPTRHSYFDTHVSWCQIDDALTR